MTKRRDNKIHMIPIESIEILNPRERGQRKFKQIVSNISQIGLKKPITVTKKVPANGVKKYDLVCGQGRLEAYQTIGESEIPALIVEVSKQEMFLMSLIENLARRNHSSVEHVKDIASMRERGYTFAQIAKKTALEIGYVRGMVKLLKNGEERLLQAVEKGTIPISIAVTIASSDDVQVQRVMTEAYEENKLRGRRLINARRLIEKRKTNGKGLRNVRSNGKAVNSSNSLLRTYKKETERQRVVIQKARLCETRLLFVVSALRQLFGDENFIELLQLESLESLPSYLVEQLNEEQS